MVKTSPRRNSSIYIAMVVGLGGIVGGVAAIMGGVYLEAFDGKTLDMAGFQFSNYHSLFVLGCMLRIVAAILSHSIVESGGHRMRDIVRDTVRPLLGR